MTLPRVYFTVDGAPVGMSDWSANTTANIGHDQFRGTIAASVARALSVDQGSVLGAWTEYGFPMWEGRIAGPPKQQQDGTAVIAAQGHGYAADKFAQRFPVIVSQREAWTDASKAPLNYPTSATNLELLMGQGRYEGIVYLTDTDIAMKATGTAPPEVSAAIGIWAPGVRFTRFTGTLHGDTNYRIQLSSAEGPNVAGTRRVEYATTTINSAVDITFSNPGDALLLEVIQTSGGFLGNTYTKIATAPVAYAGVSTDLVYAEDAARAIGDRVGLDTSYIGHPGGAGLTHFDWAGGASGALDELATLDDLCWLVLEDRGAGPVMLLDGYRERWRVSARTGARWDLDPLEAYNRVVAQWRDAAGNLGQIEFTADPDPLVDSGLVNELQLNIASRQSGTNYPQQMAIRALRAGVTERWRGRIAVARAFAPDGREATYELRPGVLVDISDQQSTTGLVLRVHDVAYGPGGIVIGVEAPSLPVGMEAVSAGAVARPPAYEAPAVLDIAPSYLPPGGPGGADSQRRGPSPNFWKNPHY